MSCPCSVTHEQVQYCKFHMITFDGCPFLHKFSSGNENACTPAPTTQTYPKVSVLSGRVTIPISARLLANGSWRVKGVKGSSLFWDWYDRQCQNCDWQNSLDLVSCVTLCDQLFADKECMTDAWAPVLSPVVLLWLQGQGSVGEIRTFARKCRLLQSCA